MIIDQQRGLIKTYEQYQNTAHKTSKTILKPSELSQLTNVVET